MTDDLHPTTPRPATASSDKIVWVSRRIHADAATIFELLADPARHAEIDGSGTVRESHGDNPARLSLGARFGMDMKMGVPYKISNEVVEFVENPTRELLVAWMRSMVYDPAILTEEFVESRWQAAMEPAAMEGIKKIYSREMLDILRTMMLDNTATLSMLRQIQAPTLITWGRDDRVTPLDGAIGPMRLIRNCELHVFHDCGHWSMLERKDEFESTVLAFLLRDLG